QRIALVRQVGDRIIYLHIGHLKSRSNTGLINPDFIYVGGIVVVKRLLKIVDAAAHKENILPGRFESYFRIKAYYVGRDNCISSAVESKVHVHLGQQVHIPVEPEIICTANDEPWCG